MTSSDFSGVPLVAGELYGMRSFSVTNGDTPVLTGVSFTSMWHDGVNRSHCVFTGHQSPQRSCSCGFYAYFAGTKPTWRSERRIDAIVRGTGRCIVGSKGFRAEKAEIVAFIRPGTFTHASRVKPIHRPMAALHAFNVAHPILFGIVMFLLVQLFIQLGAHTGNIWMFVVVIALYVPFIYSVVNVANDPVMPGAKIKNKTWNKVIDSYNVPVYTSLEKAQEKFTLTRIEDI